MDAALAKKVCRLIAGIVVADDDLDDTEDAFLDRMLVRFGVDPKERDMLFPIADKDEAAAEIASLPVDVQHEATTLLLGAAVADGKVAPEERAFLHAVAEAIGIAPGAMEQKIEAALRARKG